MPTTKKKAPAKKPNAPKPDGDDLLTTLRRRFEAHPERHRGLDWASVEARLSARPAKLRALEAMEQSGGEPDVIAHDAKSGELTFADCSPESPDGRRSVCFDPQALESRKEHKPKHSALGMAKEMGIELLSEAQYRELQALGPFDQKTSSWIATPPEVRALGGALFGDHRFGRVFTYHNGAESYYAARGFRGSLKV